jgi:Tat protein secretion system quality control protein TatD with DNase activity
VLRPAKDGDWDTVARLIASPHVVGVGETGLDRHWDFTPFDVQQDYFDRHLQLAQWRDLPFVITVQPATEASIRAAIARMAELNFLVEPPLALRSWQLDREGEMKCEPTGASSSPRRA